MTPETAPEQAGAAAGKPKLLDKLLALGAVGLVVWWIIFALTMAGFIIAIKAGWKPESGAGEAGVIGVAYIATQVTKPVRLAATMAITPLVAKVWKAFKARKERRED